MYRKIEDFINDWTYEYQSTLKVFNNLTNESITNKINQNVRTAGRLFWHIKTSIGEKENRTGLKFNSVPENTKIPSIVNEITSYYKELSDNIIQEIKEKTDK